MLPRPNRPPAPPAAAREAGPLSFDALKARVLAKLEDRFDLSASKRVPQSILRQSLRQQAEQVADAESRGMPKPDRDRLVDAVLAEMLGYGPLEELFADAAVREAMVAGPGAVIARREQGHWLPTSVQFRDEAHVRAVLDRMAAHADAVGPVMASVGAFDARLPNGFRAIAVIPPEALGRPATAAFVRESPAPAAAAPKDAAAGAAPAPKPAPTPPPRLPGSGPVATPPPRASATESASAASDPLARHRNRILERLLTKFASVGLYDVQKLDVNELRRIIEAFVTEYAEAERVYLSDTEQGRLTLEVLTALRK